MRVINNIRMSLLAAWLGLAIYFSAVVAPGNFGVLRSFGVANAMEIAGTLVGRSLSAVNKSGLLLGLLLLVSGPAVKKFYGRASFILQNALLIIVAISTAVGEWVIAANMRGLRAAINAQFGQGSPTDSNHVAFMMLHLYSVAALCVAMIAGLIVILLMVVSRERVVTTPTE